MNPAMLQAGMAIAQGTMSLLSMPGKVKGLQRAYKKNEKNINIKQASSVKAMEETFIQKIHDFNNTYAVAQSDARSSYENVASEQSMNTIGMEGSSYFAQSKSVMDQQYSDMLVNMMNKHKDDYFRMSKMHKNQLDATINNFGQQRLDNVQALYDGTMQVYAETNKALMGAAESGAVAGYQASNSGQLPTSPYNQEFDTTLQLQGYQTQYPNAFSKLNFGIDNVGSQYGNFGANQFDTNLTLGGQ